MNKLLLIGSGTVHTYNYYRLIEGSFDRIRLITDRIIPGNEDINTVMGNFEIRNPINICRNIQSIRKQIRKFRPDLIHVQQANSIAWLSIRANKPFGIPLIVTAWGSDILDLPNRNLILRNMVAYSLRKADALTADAHIVEEKINALSPGLEKPLLIANFGIDPFYRPMKKENVIYSNRLHRKLYRIDEIIRAFNRFRKDQDIEWKLIVAGDDAETESLKKLVAALKLNGHVDFVGWVDKDNNNLFYNRSRIYVSIPSTDATAISLLEAMHAGCIPVVADIPVSHEWIQDDVNGIIVKSMEENFIQRALAMDPEKVMTINQDIIKKRGLKHSNREKFINLYNQMLGT